jgi:molecular chaperone GrpE
MRSREKDRLASEQNENEGEIRVTDRRRRFLSEDLPDATDSTAPSPSLKPSYVEELETRTKAAEQLALDVQARFEKLKNQLQRETDETRQRLNRAADDRTERSKAEFIASLLPVLDNLERAIEAAYASGSSEQLIEGVKKTAESFTNALTAAGVEPVAAQGELFDPKLHEAVETIPVEPEMDGKVMKVYTSGYRMGDRLLRPAGVAVGHASEQARGASD